MSAVQQRLFEKMNSSGPLWLRGIQHLGRQQWQALPWPGRKSEDWKYTSLRTLEKLPLNDFPVVQSRPHPIDSTQEIAGLDAYRMVFCDGVFDATQSNIGALPEGVTLVNFVAATGLQIEQLQQALNGFVDATRHLFSALNSACLLDGAFLHLAPGVNLDKPVLLVNSSSDGEQVAYSSPRVLVVLEKSATATVIEQYLSGRQDEQSPHFACAITELYVEENAELEHYRLHLEQHQHIHIGGVHAILQRNARLHGFHLALGSLLKRIDLVVHHRGEGAACTLNGVYLPGRDQLVDYHTCVEHAVPHCTTNETFRGIVADNGRAVFNGRIHIHPNAQKTSALLSNRNLLTSDKAEVDTKPELEIYADDVQCAHGATVAQLDETAMHYFLTRGISAKEAEVMLSFGFINELLNTIKLQPIAEHLRPMLAAKFAHDPELLRHIV